MTKGFTVDVYDCGDKAGSLFTTPVEEEAKAFAAELSASFETAFPSTHKYHGAYEVVVSQTTLGDRPTSRVFFYSEYTEWDSLSAKKGVIEVITAVAIIGTQPVVSFAAPYYVRESVADLVTVLTEQDIEYACGVFTDDDYLRRFVAVGTTEQVVYEKVEEFINTSGFVSDEHDALRAESIVKHQNADTFLADLFKGILDKSGIPSR